MHALRYTVGAERTGQINTPAWPVDEVGGHLQVYLEEQLKQETKTWRGGECAMQMYNIVEGKTNLNYG
jgi:hypothetical protein